MIYVLSFAFQSTLPAKGATKYVWRVERVQFDFNPRSPRRERRCEAIHSSALRYFNPRSPRRERRRVMQISASPEHISIHAPREGSDDGTHTVSVRTQDFNPRSPRRERRRHRSLLCVAQQFQSTLPAKGATRVDIPPRRKFCISIHAPREGSDSISGFSSRADFPFQSTLPAKGATSSALRVAATRGFQSTLPAKGATRYQRRVGR